MNIKSEFIEVCKLVSQKGFVAATDGNISYRIDLNKILCTPSGKPKGKLEADDLIYVDLNGEFISGKGKPTTEIKMHCEIYKRRNDIKAVVHCHPCYATAFASAGMPIDKCVFPEVILTLGAIPICEYATPSTEEVVNSIREYVEKTDVLLLRNHGAVTYGKSLYEAYYKMEKLEHTAKTLFIARLLGGENILSNNDLKKLYKANDETYKIDLTHKIKCKTIEETENFNLDKNEIKNIIQEIIREYKGDEN